MKIVIFGLTISSTWGNGHATVWRALARAMARRGHTLLFFEHDVPYYADNRDLTHVPGGKLLLYRDWKDVVPLAQRELADADVGLVTSFCPHGIEATTLLLQSNARVRVFYDLDPPITLSRLAAGETLSWIGPRGLRDFDLVLSFTGGRVGDALRHRLGARRVVPLYGSVDPEIHRPAPVHTPVIAGLSYIGTYSDDRQASLEMLFIRAARARPDYRFVIAGCQYPEQFPWCENIFFVRHLPVAEHPAFFASSRMTLNVTRAPMAAMGHCPSGRLFEAAACGTPIISDVWDGISDFYEPGREILLARSTRDVLAAMALTDAELGRIAAAARERTLARHTGAQRAIEFERALDLAHIPPSPAPGAAALMET